MAVLEGPVSAIKLVNRIRAQALDVILCMQLSELLITSIKAQTLFLLLRLVLTKKSSIQHSWVEKFRHVFCIKSHAWESLASMILLFICISSLKVVELLVFKIIIEKLCCYIKFIIWVRNSFKVLCWFSISILYVRN